MSTAMTFKTVKQLDTAIDQIIIGARNQREMIQHIAIGIVAHAAGKGSGNVTRAKKLVDGLGDGVRRDSLVEWFALTGIMFDEQGEVTLNRDLLIPACFTEAKRRNWWEIKKAPSPYKGFDFKAVLIKQLKQAYQASEAAKDAEKADKVHMSDKELKALEQFVQSQVGAADMPKKPDSLKKNTGNVTAVAKKAA